MQHSSDEDSPYSAQPSLHHTIAHDQASVLAIAIDEASSLLFTSGTQSECIYVWNLDTYRPITKLSGHTASILTLELAPERGWLFSASGDGTVRIWDTRTLSLLYIFQQPPTEEDEDTTMGDIFSLRWSKEMQTLYMGCQNTSIRWVRLSRLRSRGRCPFTESETTTASQEQDRYGKSDMDTEGSPSRGTTQDTDYTGFLPASAMPIAPRPHKFFDSGPSGPSHSSSSTTPLSRSFSRTQSAFGVAGNHKPSPSTPPPANDSPYSHSPGRRTPELRFLPTTESAGDDQGGRLSPTFDAALDRVLRLREQSQEGPTATGADPRMSEDQSTDVARYVQLSQSCKVPNAHYGYVYSLALISLGSLRPVVLASGSGDEDVKLWDCSSKRKGQVELIATLSGSEGAVLALASWPGTLFAGKQGGSIDVWDLETMTLIRTLEAHGDDVLSLCTSVNEDGSSCLISAGADGCVARFDGNFARRDLWAAHQDAIVLSCAIVNERPRRASTRIITGGSDQVIRFWDLAPLDRGEDSLPHDGSQFPRKIGFPLTSSSHIEDPNGHVDTKTITEMSFDPLLTELAKFVSYKSVSSEARREDCRQCAHYLKQTLSSLGAQESAIIPGAPGRNPLVLSIFRARSGSPDQPRAAPHRRVLFYGHYDVISARADKTSSGWSSDPFTLSGRDGYLYARGASDNKGPVLSVATAISRLWNSRRLDVDVVMLIEGEEESGSVGFKEALEREKERIGKIDVVLLSNSYWIDDVTPCLTMGMRGVIQATVTISAASIQAASSESSAATTARTSPSPHRRGEEKDVHSGVQGGAVREPMIDMLRLLSSLSDGERVFVPDFYDSVRPVTTEERASYEAIVELLSRQSRDRDSDLDFGNTQEGHAGCQPSGRSKNAAMATVESLMARWRFPSLSIHSISVSGSGNATVIPAVVTAKVSLRLVPDQDLEVIKSSLVSFLNEQFDRLAGARPDANRLQIDVHHVADWWLGSSTSPYTCALADSISQTWSSPCPGSTAAAGISSPSSSSSSVLPLQIREGGSIPTVALLEKALGAPAVHLPMGQSSDNAHLGDERISMQHLLRGREVVERWLGKLAHLPLDCDEVGHRRTVPAK
ncbi:Zn-dependent exopeptidase [Microstroma glucosiphilum]|uniref:Zn-dependent exopeptidase n=1 Tax=Pseudomicrostroma glucosiphilum TaxID=1684307 RepID=A0A316U2I5_9BASI|nr:Zn-dependent exopeptidase [Pseudomicrostroma glucosiphilum]PWN19549.1 Zn-dependent exopeptidase [Pseudomicrostroma glucosiphilum]